MEARRFWSSTDGGGMGRVGRVEGGRRAGFSPSLLGHPPPTLTYLLAHRLQASRTYARAHCMPPLNALSHSLRPYVRTSGPFLRPRPGSGRTQLHSLSLGRRTRGDRTRTLLGHRNRATAGGTGGRGGTPREMEGGVGHGGCGRPAGGGGGGGGQRR